MSPPVAAELPDGLVAFRIDAAREAAGGGGRLGDADAERLGHDAQRMPLADHAHDLALAWNRATRAPGACGVRLVRRDRELRCVLQEPSAQGARVEAEAVAHVLEREGPVRVHD